MKLGNNKGKFFDKIKERLRNDLENMRFVKGLLKHCVPYKTEPSVLLSTE